MTRFMVRKIKAPGLVRIATGRNGDGESGRRGDEERKVLSDDSLRVSLSPTRPVPPSPGLLVLTLTAARWQSVLSSIVRFFLATDLAKYFLQCAHRRKHRAGLDR